jgi:hypothetical protein
MLNNLFGPAKEAKAFSPKLGKNLILERRRKEKLG